MKSIRILLLCIGCLGVSRLSLGAITPVGTPIKAMTENRATTHNSFYLNTTSSQTVIGSTIPRAGYILTVNGPIYASSISVPTEIVSTGTFTQLIIGSTVAIPSSIMVAQGATFYFMIQNDGRIAVGGIPDGQNINELAHFQATQNYLGGQPSVDTVVYNAGDGEARTYVETGAGNTTRSINMVNCGTGCGGPLWTNGPNFANSIGFEEDRNGGYNSQTGLSTATFYMNMQSANWIWRTSTSSQTIIFMEGVSAGTTCIINNGVYLAPPGSAIEPSHGFWNDTAGAHSGMYKVAPNRLGFVTADTERYELNTSSINFLGLTLDNISSGTVINRAAAYQQIKTLQVVSATIAASSATTSTAFAKTSLAASITPVSASNQVKISFSSVIVGSIAATEYDTTIMRNGVNILGARGCAEHGAAGTSIVTVESVSCVYLDSPSTTSSVTYTIAIKGGAGTTTFGDTGLTSSIILEEINGL